MTFTDDQVKALSAKLDGAHVKPPPQGKYGSYVEGWHVIAEANRIFGFDGWSYRVDSLTMTNQGTAKIWDKKAEAKVDGTVVGYMALVTVTVGETSRQDVGHGQGFSKSEGDAYDSAIKEAVTDGLKRALRTFGNVFGLALYDKSGENVEHSNGSVRLTGKTSVSKTDDGGSSPPPQRQTAVNPAFQQQKAEDLIRIIRATETIDDLTELWVAEEPNVRRLSESWRQTITNTKDEQKRKLSQVGVEAG